MKRIFLSAAFCMTYVCCLAQNNTFPASGNVGIGTTVPGAKISFNNLNDGTAEPDGITWYSPKPLSYGIFRTAGAWAAPDYSQLNINFETGIIIDPGNQHTRSFVELKGGGLRITEGNIGIHTLNPSAKISFNDLNDGSDKPDGITWYNPEPLRYGIFKSPGSWAGPNFQQLVLNFETGIVLNPGTSYGKSYVDVQGGGLRVSSGSIGIGTTDTQGYKLAVNGNIRAKEVKVENSNWPDYVFTHTYQLPTLEETEQQILKLGHLPGIPSAAEVKEKGVDLGDLNAKLLQKLEEVMLHLIELKKENTRQQIEIQILKDKVNLK